MSGYRDHGLTEQHVRIIDLLSTGSTAVEVAHELDVSVHLVHKRIKQALRGSGVRNSTSLVAKAIREGWIDMGATIKVRQWLNPGSEGAVLLGCLCPVIDNHYGKGYQHYEGKPKEKQVFMISGNCAMHKDAK